MSKSAGRAIAVAGIASAIVAGGTAVASAQSSGDQGAVSYHISEHSVIAGPSHFRPGLVKFRVTGAAGHSLQFLRSRHGAGRAVLTADVNELNTTGSANKLERDFRLYGGSSTGSTLYLTLKPGTYFLADTAARTVAKDKVRVIRVSGRASRAADYRKSATIRAVHEMSWAKSPASIPASGYLRFANDSTDPHFVVLARLKPGKTLADAKKAMQGQEKYSDVVYGGPRSNFDNGVISSRRSETVSYDLRPGRYVLVCFWPDEHGMPHAMMGMLRTIKLR